jgi:rRNA maturation protein Nop10
MSKQTDYPDDVCTPCGVTANTMACVKKYGERPLKDCFTTSTMHEGQCDVCGTNTYVTNPRCFFYPDPRAFKYLKRYLKMGGEL